MFASYVSSLTEIPGHITCVVFTYGCDGICDYCYNRDLWKSRLDKQVTKQEILDYIDRCNRKYRLITAVSITGAEPLTCAEDVKDLAFESSIRGLYVSLDTSLTQGLVSDILPHLSRIAITVKSAWSKYMSYVVENLKRIEHMKTPVEIRLVFTETNIASVLNNFQWMLQKFDINTETIVVRPAVVTETNRNRFKPITLGEFQNIVSYVKTFCGDKYALRVVEI